MQIERWSPVTSDMGLIQAPPLAVATQLTDWHRSIGIDYRRAQACSLSEALGLLPPLSAEKRRTLLVPTTAGWTAYFQSGINGSDPFPAMSHLSRRMGAMAMRVCATAPGALWPAVVWEVYAPPELGGRPPLGYRRSVAAMNDGGRWVFEQSGEPFPFEETEKYARPRKRDRFTREMLQAYLQAFGLTPWSDDFYRVSDETPAILLESLKRWASPPPEYALDEVRGRAPWARA
jgi:hypothetical protein